MNTLPILHHPAPSFRVTIRERFRLRAGDVVDCGDGPPWTVLRVTDCAAVISRRGPAREIVTQFAGTARLPGRPEVARIAPNSQVQIISRKTA